MYMTNNKSLNNDSIRINYLLINYNFKLLV